MDACMHTCLPTYIHCHIRRHIHIYTYTAHIRTARIQHMYTKYKYTPIHIDTYKIFKKSYIFIYIYRKIYVYVYLCLFISLFYLYMYIRVFAYHIHIHIYLYTYTHLHIHIHIPMPAWIWIWMWICICWSCHLWKESAGQFLQTCCKQVSCLSADLVRFL